MDEVVRGVDPLKYPGKRLPIENVPCDDFCFGSPRTNGPRLPGQTANSVSGVFQSRQQSAADIAGCSCQQDSMPQMRIPLGRVAHLKSDTAVSWSDYNWLRAK